MGINILVRVSSGLCPQLYNIILVSEFANHTKPMKKAMPTKRKRYSMPKDMQLALKENDVQEAYNARPPYQRNDYIGWITRAKQDATRLKRINQMVAELKKGNVYMKMVWKGK
jgi:uncharacterized protein YdeI (YjbR/CyaY-like superfamily)